MSYTTGILAETISKYIYGRDELINDVDLLQSQESFIHLIRTEYIHRFDISENKKLTSIAFRKLQSAAFNHGCAAIIKVADEYAPVIVWPTKRDSLGRPSEGVCISPFRVDVTTGKYAVLYKGKPQDLTKIPVLEFATYQGFFNGNTLMGPVGLDIIRPYVALYNLQMRKLSLTIYKSVPMVISLLTEAQNANIINAYKTNARQLITSINSQNKVSGSYNKSNNFLSQQESGTVQGKISRLDTQFDTNEEIRALDAIMDKCRDSLGIRKEPRFKAERKISSEVDSENEIFQRSEKVQEQQLLEFIKQFNDYYDSNVEIINNIESQYSDDLEIQTQTSQFKPTLGDS